MAAGAASERMGWVPAPRQGWVAPHIASEFPGLGIAWVEVDAKPGRSPEPVRQRLRDLSDRTYGVAGDPPAGTADPLGLPRLLPPDRPRPRPHPHPGRAADPRPAPRRRLPQPRPAGRRAQRRDRRDRGRAARLRRRGDRGRALHPRLRAGGVARRGGRPSWRRGRWRSPTSAGPVGLLFGPTAEGLGVEKRTRRIAVAAVQVKGVPQIAVEEALWMAAATLEAA